MAIQLNPHTNKIEHKAFVEIRVQSWMNVALIFALTLAACGPRPIPAPPTPTPLPPTPTLPAVTGQPKDLILQLEDLPVGFVLAGEDTSGVAYSVVYLRPEALSGQLPASATLVGVIANFSLAEAMATAQQQFADQTTDIEAIVKDVQTLSGNAGNVEVEPETVNLAGVDEVAAYRVHYAIGGTPLLEFRYRLRVGNALANLIVTTTGATTDETKAREQALAVVQKQVDRINQSR